MRLPHTVLVRAHQVILRVHEAADAAALRQAIVAGLEELIACDRASFNLFDLAAARIAPTPVPAWWSQYGEVYRQHMLDHPLVDPARRPALNTTVSWDDKPYARRWRNSTLHQEYFRPLGVRSQLGSVVHQSGAVLVALAVNRSDRSFSEEERSIFDLLNPHFALAWKKQMRLTKAVDVTSTATDEREVSVACLSSASSNMLTGRERQVLQWLGEGKRSNEIAVILGISPRTVEKHVEHILAKLGVETRGAAVREYLNLQRLADA